MSDSSAADPSRGGTPKAAPQSPDDLLPAVQAPGAGFILQLFLIPLLIVSCVVALWLLFTWLAGAGATPRDLVRNMKKLNDARWQQAVTLADQLSSAEYGHLKDDPKLAADIVEVLTAELDAASTDEPRLKLRIFLCRVLGEFRVTTGAAALVRAATQQKDPSEIHVRASAIESLAVLAKNVGPEKLLAEPWVLDAVMEGSREMGTGPDEKNFHAEVRSRAAFALGVFGGEKPIERLNELLSDAYPNVRYNAAIGLARHGDLRCHKTLLEMLDPTSTASLKYEKSDSQKQVKLQSILVNGIRAVEQLVAVRAGDNPQSAEVAELRDAVKALANSKQIPSGIAKVAESLVLLWEKEAKK